MSPSWIATDVSRDVGRCGAEVHARQLLDIPFERLRPPMCSEAAKAYMISQASPSPMGSSHPFSASQGRSRAYAQSQVNGRVRSDLPDDLSAAALLRD
jgi:hypothetical protein